MKDFLFDVIATELEDAVEKENCSTRTIDKLTQSLIVTFQNAVLQVLLQEYWKLLKMKVARKNVNSFQRVN